MLSLQLSLNSISVFVSLSTYNLYDLFFFISSFVILLYLYDVMLLDWVILMFFIVFCFIPHKRWNPPGLCNCVGLLQVCNLPRDAVELCGAWWLPFPSMLLYCLLRVIVINSANFMIIYYGTHRSHGVSNQLYEKKIVKSNLFSVFLLVLLLF